MFICMCPNPLDGESSQLVKIGNYTKSGNFALRWFLLSGLKYVCGVSVNDLSKQLCCTIKTISSE